MRCGCGEKMLPELRLIAYPLLLVALPAAALSACSGADHGANPGAGEWVGTVNVEGGVTTVANTSGSVWRGNAFLVEEASIGVEAGADEYMFGVLFAVRATDEHIYVTDEQADMVRRYDFDGVFVDNVGATGQGPGEYGDPAMVAVTGDERIIVFDFAADRMQIYAPDSQPLESWPAPNTGCCTSPMLVDDTGTLWAPTLQRDPESGELIFGIRAFGTQGPIEPEYRVRVLDVPTAELDVGPFSMGMPLMPQFTWTMASPGRVLAGGGDSRIRRPLLAAHLHPRCLRPPRAFPRRGRDATRYLSGPTLDARRRRPRRGGRRERAGHLSGQALSLGATAGGFALMAESAARPGSRAHPRAGGSSPSTSCACR